jgi:multiple sugar transport system permease protein
MTRHTPRRGSARRARWGPLFAAQVVVIALLVVFAVFPVAWTLITSLKPESDIVTTSVQYLPAHPTLDNYFGVLATRNVPVLMKNSAIVAAITVALSMSFGTVAAYSLSRMRFPARRSILLFYLLVRMAPIVLLLIPMFLILARAGLLDSYLGLALAYTAFALPLVVFVMKNFFDGVPAEIEDAARVDGCSRLGALVRVVIPLTLPGLAVTSLLVAISSWNEFLLALMFTSSDASRTWPVGLSLLVGKFTVTWGKLAAGGVLTILPIFLIYAFVGRSLVRGLMAGGVKG